MKRLSALLILFLMLPACALAFDLSPYEIDSLEGTVADPHHDLTDYRLFPGDLSSNPRICGDIYIGLRESAGDNAAFMLYDQNRYMYLHGQLPSQKATYTARDDGDSTLFCFLLPVLETGMQTLITRISKSGEVYWQHMEPATGEHSYRSIETDGAGGAWLTINAANKIAYAGVDLAHVSTNGNIDFTRTLSTREHILKVHTSVPHPSSNTSTLYCSLVAKSKGVYTAFAVTLDPEGNILHTEARDFSLREDTGFSFIIDNNHQVWVYSRGQTGYGQKSVLVPFYDLPILQPPSVSFD